MSLGLLSVYRLGSPTSRGDSLDCSYVRTRRDELTESLTHPAQKSSPYVTRTRTYGFSQLATLTNQENQP